MTGYISSGALLERVRDLIAEIHLLVVHVCDPAMGDHTLRPC